MKIEEKIKTAKEDSWLKDSVSEKEFKEIKDNERRMTKVDLISRKEVLNAIGEEKWEYLDYLERDIGGNYDVHISCFTEQIEKRIEELPTYSAEQTAEEPIKHFGAIECPNCGRLLMLEEQTYGWCKGCKEYDTEKHCCHRYSSFIRESLQENINAVLEDIKDEVQKLLDECSCYEEIRFGYIDAIKIIDKHISGKEE